MEGSRGPGNRGGRPEGAQASENLRPAMGMPVPVGGEHWKAPERLRSAAETPREQRVSSRSAGSRAGQTPWGADPTRRGSPRRTGEKAREGTSVGESPCDGSGITCFEGGLGCPGTMAMEPGRRGSSASAGPERPTSYSSEFEDWTHRGQGGAADVATRPGLTVRKDSRSRTP
jgi:hypothetical protein